MAVSQETRERCDWAWVVVDPELGDISCDDEEHAVNSAPTLNAIRIDYWWDGEVVASETYREFLGEAA